VKSFNRIARAKINLTLHVTGKREDGYHLLDSLVVFADSGDLLTFEEADALTLSVDGPFAQGVPTDKRNLVMQAAQLMRPQGHGAHIHLTKNLPHGGGIGGGSSDAATAVKGLADLWCVPEPSTDELLSLGADVPVCAAAPVSMIMRGIGEDLTPAPALPMLWCLLVNPGVHVPTAAVFQQLSTDGAIENARMTLPQSIDLDWLKRQRNDMTSSTVALVPEVAGLLNKLAKLPDVLHYNMSGSGSTCWALFDTKKAAQVAAASFSNQFWTLVTPIGG